MRMAEVIVTDEDGWHLWRGSLHAFLRANEYTRAEVHEIVEQLRPRANWLYREPIPIGGGAAPPFGLILAGALSQTAGSNSRTALNEPNGG